MDSKHSSQPFCNQPELPLSVRSHSFLYFYGNSPEMANFFCFTFSFIQSFPHYLVMYFKFFFCHQSLNLPIIVHKVLFKNNFMLLLLMFWGLAFNVVFSFSGCFLLIGGGEGCYKLCIQKIFREGEGLKVVLGHCQRYSQVFDFMFYEKSFQGKCQVLGRRWKNRNKNILTHKNNNNIS